MKKIAILICLFTILINLRSHNSCPIGKVEEKIRCFITISIIGGYSGYARLGINLIEEEPYVKSEIYKCSFEVPYLTKFNENGQISGFAKPDQLIKTRYIQNGQKYIINEIISSIKEIKLQSSASFNAKEYSSNHGTCDSIGYWIHFESAEESFYIFGKEAAYGLESLLTIIDEGKKNPKKIKNQ